MSIKILETMIEACCKKHVPLSLFDTHIIQVGTQVMGTDWADPGLYTATAKMVSAASVFVPCVALLAHCLVRSRRWNGTPDSTTRTRSGARWSARVPPHCSRGRVAPRTTLRFGSPAFPRFRP